MANSFHYFIPTFFYTSEITSHSEIKSLLYDKILESGGSSPWSLCNTKTSYGNPNDLLLNCTQLIDSIWETYDQLLSESFLQNSYKNKQPDESNLYVWYNIYETGDYQEIHNHVVGDCVLNYSFIYILHDESDTGVCFRSSNPNELTYSSVNTIHSKHVGVKEGTLIIFPSFVDHYVLPATGKRVTISGNIMSQ